MSFLFFWLYSYVSKFFLGYLSLFIIYFANGRFTEYKHLKINCAYLH